MERQEPYITATAPIVELTYPQQATYSRRDRRLIAKIQELLNGGAESITLRPSGKGDVVIEVSRSVTIISS